MAPSSIHPRGRSGYSDRVTTETMGIFEVRERWAALGGDPGEVVWGAVEDTVPTAPSHRPVAFPTSNGEVVVGGMDRGRFAAYGRFGDGKVAAQALLRLSVAPVAAPAPRDPVQLRRAAAGLIATLEEAAARPHPPALPCRWVGSSTTSGTRAATCSTPTARR